MRFIGVEELLLIISMSNFFSIESNFSKIESIWKVCFDKNQFGECHEECEKDIAPFTELTS